MVSAWRRFLERGGYWVLTQSVLMTAILLLAPWRPGEPGGAWERAWAWGLLSVGGVVGILGAWHLKPNRTIFPKPKEDSYLVQTGIYRYVRHPLYLSLLLLGLGWTLLWSSLVSGIATLVMMIFLDRKARREEAWLEKKFPAYRDYGRRVKRFLPGVY